MKNPVSAKQMISHWSKMRKKSETEQVENWVKPRWGPCFGFLFEEKTSTKSRQTATLWFIIPIGSMYGIPYTYIWFKW